MSTFLVEADVLQRDIELGDAPLLIDARTPAEYAQGHIAGAVNFSAADHFVADTRPDGLAAFARDMAKRFLLSSTVGSEAWNSRDLKSRPH